MNYQNFRKTQDASNPHGLSKETLFLNLSHRRFSMPMKQMTLVNIVTRGEIEHNEQFFFYHYFDNK